MDYFKTAFSFIYLQIWDMRSITVTETTHTHTHTHTQNTNKWGKEKKCRLLLFLLQILCLCIRMMVQFVTCKSSLEWRNMTPAKSQDVKFWATWPNETQGKEYTILYNVWPVKGILSISMSTCVSSFLSSGLLQFDSKRMLFRQTATFQLEF